jgi:hypothetical protein
VCPTGVFVTDDFAGSSDLSVVTQMAAGAPRYVLRFSSIDEQVPSSYYPWSIGVNGNTAETAITG